MLTFLFQSYIWLKASLGHSTEGPFKQVSYSRKSLQMSLSAMHKHHHSQIHRFTSNCVEINIQLRSSFAFICFEKGMAARRKEISTSKHESEFSNSDVPHYFFQSGRRLTWITLTLFFSKPWRKWKIRNINQRHSQLSARKTSLNCQEISQIHALLF